MSHSNYREKRHWKGSPLASRSMRKTPVEDRTYKPLSPTAPPAKSKYDLKIKTIRRALHSLAPSLSVKRGSGTASAWIEVSGSKAHGKFTEDEENALKIFGVSAGGNLAVISPEDRDYWAEKAEGWLKTPQEPNSPFAGYGDLITRVGPYNLVVNPWLSYVGVDDGRTNLFFAQGDDAKEYADKKPLEIVAQLRHEGRF